jgi:hypothetical protein
VIESIIKPKRPVMPGWHRERGWTAPIELRELGYPVEAWSHPANGLFVLSAVEKTSEPGKPDLGPEYHISISANGQRCTSGDAVWALAQFDLIDAKEDNHVPSGRVRNFWRPVADHLSGYECPCVDEEPAVVEDKGDYIWRGVSA